MCTAQVFSEAGYLISSSCSTGKGCEHLVLDSLLATLRLLSFWALLLPASLGLVWWISCSVQGQMNEVFFFHRATPFSDLPLSSGFWSRQNTAIFSHLHSRDQWHQPDLNEPVSPSQPRLPASALPRSPLPGGILLFCGEGDLAQVSDVSDNDTCPVFLSYGEIYLVEVPYMSSNGTHPVETIQWYLPWAVLSQTMNFRGKVRTTKEGECWWKRWGQR